MHCNCAIIISDNHFNIFTYLYNPNTVDLFIFVFDIKYQILQSGCCTQLHCLGLNGNFINATIISFYGEIVAQTSNVCHSVDKTG